MSPSPHELPKGLDSYEFIRDLTQDGKIPWMWHYIPRLNQETEKPLLTLDGMPDLRPTPWNEIFGQPTPRIEIEIGSGKGGFLVEHGKANPDCFMIGSEWDASWAAHCADRLRRHKLDHVRMLRADVFYFLRDRVPADSVDAFHMYFPDPWPKTRQQKNRLLRPAFLEQVARTLKPGKRMFYWGTDHAGYNEAAHEIFATTPNLTVLVKDVAEPTCGIMTNFEKKYRREGRPIYRSVLQFEK